MADLGAVGHRFGPDIVAAGRRTHARNTYAPAGTAPGSADISDSISGTVAVEGSPTANIRVRLLFRGKEIAARYTDESGDYAFDEVSPNQSYTLKI